MRFELDRVDVAFDDVVVLRGLSLVLTEHRIGVVGDNGSGKSTLARLLNGLVLPTRGSVVVDGRDTRHAADDVRRDVGFVFQNADSQIIMPTVAEDIGFGLKIRGVGQARIDTKVDDVLSRFAISHLRDRPSHFLSGGEKQLLALAGVIAMDPKSIIFDEPTTMLDRRHAARMMATIGDLPHQAIVVTHHVELLEGFDRVIVLEQGQVIADDAPSVAVPAYLGRDA